VIAIGRARRFRRGRRRSRPGLAASAIVATSEAHDPPSPESRQLPPAAVPLLTELWREQSLWSRTADRMKAGIERARLAALVLVVAVAVLATTAGALAGVAPVPARVLAAAAAVGAAVLPTLRPAWSGRRLRDWTRARSVSEALKSDVYLWLAGAGRYRSDPEGAALRLATDRVRADAGDLLRYRHGIEAAERDLPAVRDLPGYFDVRVRAQIVGYYQRKADRHARTLRGFRIAEIALGAVGAVLGGVAAVVGASFAPWIAVLATVGTALATHVAASRYEFQLIEFLRTAERLRQLAGAATTATPDALDALAVKAEEVISVENQGWMAKLAEDPPAQQASAGSASS
jgi:hypothetical protein